jgi:hypothetical protein
VLLQLTFVACVGNISHGDLTLHNFEGVVGDTNVVGVETNANRC